MDDRATNPCVTLGRIEPTLLSKILTTPCPHRSRVEPLDVPPVRCERTCDTNAGDPAAQLAVAVRPRLLRAAAVAEVEVWLGPSVERLKKMTPLARSVIVPRLSWACTWIGVVRVKLTAKRFFARALVMIARTPKTIGAIRRMLAFTHPALWDLSKDPRPNALPAARSAALAVCFRKMEREPFL